MEGKINIEKNIVTLSFVGVALALLFIAVYYTDKNRSAEKQFDIRTIEIDSCEWLVSLYGSRVDALAHKPTCKHCLLITSLKTKDTNVDDIFKTPYRVNVNGTSFVIDTTKFYNKKWN